MLLSALDSVVAGGEVDEEMMIELKLWFNGIRVGLWSGKLLKLVWKIEVRDILEEDLAGKWLFMKFWKKKIQFKLGFVKYDTTQNQ